MRDMRGRGHGFPFPGDGASTLSAEPDAKYNGAGFRLAVVNDCELVAGGSYLAAGGAYSSPRGAAGLLRSGHRGPSEKYPNLGIRLVADWRER